jgi:DNA-binding HxlR family transcriptional regulator
MGYKGSIHKLRIWRTEVLCDLLQSGAVVHIDELQQHLGGVTTRSVRRYLADLEDAGVNVERTYVERGEPPRKWLAVRIAP